MPLSASTPTTIRIRRTYVNTYCVERYSGHAHQWFALAYYPERQEAFEDARRRRLADHDTQVICAECCAYLGPDWELNCSVCGARGLVAGEAGERGIEYLISVSLDVFWVLLCLAIVALMTARTLAK